METLDEYLELVAERGEPARPLSRFIAVETGRTQWAGRRIEHRTCVAWPEAAVRLNMQLRIFRRAARSARQASGSRGSTRTFGSNFPLAPGGCSASSENTTAGERSFRVVRES